MDNVRKLALNLGSNFVHEYKCQASGHSKETFQN